MAFLEKRRRLRQAQQVKEDEENHVPIDIFNSQPMLGIFSKTKTEENKSKQPIELPMWNKCREREMKILSSSAPKNLLEEMAIKTEQGILWEFPINNEQGIDQDKVSYQNNQYLFKWVEGKMRPCLQHLAPNFLINISDRALSRTCFSRPSFGRMVS